METGKLNRKVTIVQPGSLTSDGLGGFIESTVTNKDVWASVRKLTMKEIVTFGLKKSVDNYMFSFQYHTGKNLTGNYRLIYEGKTLNIYSIDDPNEAHEQINVIANG